MLLIGILVLLFCYKKNLSENIPDFNETLVDLFSQRKFVTKQKQCFKILFSEKILRHIKLPMGEVTATGTTGDSSLS